jgi:hypothetical protein
MFGRDAVRGVRRSLRGAFDSERIALSAVASQR